MPRPYVLGGRSSLFTRWVFLVACIAPCQSAQQPEAQPYTDRLKPAHAGKGASDDHHQRLSKGGLPFNASLPPVIIVPPLTGSKLEADIDNARVANPICGLPFPKQVWPPEASTVASGLLNCWQQEMALELDEAQSRANGVEVDVDPPGVHVHTIEYGRLKSQAKSTWEAVVAQLEMLGYRDDANIYAVPYDWRKGPGYWQGKSWPRMKAAIEEYVKKHDGQPAIFLSMSMGGPYFAAFLLHSPGVDDEWKKRHVAGWVSLSGPFDGTIAALGAVLWGDTNPGKDDGKTKGFIRGAVKDVVQGFGSVSWLMPKQSHKSDERFRAVFELPPSWGSGAVTTDLIPGLLQRSSTKLAALYDIAQRYPTKKHPGVRTFCVYGTELDTPKAWRYLNGSRPIKPLTDVETATQGIKMLGDKLKVPIDADTEKMVQQALELVGDSDNVPQTPLMPQPLSAPPVTGAWLDSLFKLVENFLPEDTVYGKGDGLVEEESLSVCAAWKGKEGYPDVETFERPGFHHGSESHDKQTLLYLRATVARLAGVQNPVSDETRFATTRNPACARLKPGDGKCPGVDDRDQCTRDIVAGRVGPKDKCCVQLADMSTCMGEECMTELLGDVMAKDPKSEGAVRAWNITCSNARLPWMSSLQDFAKQENVRYDEQGDGQAACMRKMPGKGCPNIGGMGQCNAKAQGGELVDGDTCCSMMSGLLDCMGPNCFAKFIASELMAYEGRSQLRKQTLRAIAQEGLEGGEKDGTDTVAAIAEGVVNTKKAASSLARAWADACPEMKAMPAAMSQVDKETADVDQAVDRIQNVAQQYLPRLKVLRGNGQAPGLGGGKNVHGGMDDLVDKLAAGIAQAAGAAGGLADKDDSDKAKAKAAVQEYVKQALQHPEGSRAHQNQLRKRDDSYAYGYDYEDDGDDDDDEVEEDKWPGTHGITDHSESWVFAPLLVSAVVSIFLGCFAVPLCRRRCLDRAKAVETRSTQLSQMAPAAQNATPSGDDVYQPLATPRG